MKIFDAHVHLFPDRVFDAIWRWFDKNAWAIQYKYYADQVVATLAEQGIHEFLVLNYAHVPDMAASLNEWTYHFCQQYSGAHPLGTVHPDDKHPRQLIKQCFENYGFYGLKFHSHVTGIRPDDERMFPIYETLIEYNKPIVLHAGTGPSLAGYPQHTEHVSGASYVRRILERYPELKLIMPHLGADEVDEFFQLMSEYPKLYLDTTMVLAGYFDLKIPWNKIEKYSDRILYGSDFPNLPYDMMTEIQAIQKSPLSLDTQAKLLCQNAYKLLEI